MIGIGRLRGRCQRSDSLAPTAVAAWRPTWGAGTSSGLRRQLILRSGLEVAGMMALVQLLRRIADGAVDHAPALHGGPPGDRVGPALNVGVLLNLQELGGI